MTSNFLAGIAIALSVFFFLYNRYVAQAEKDRVNEHRFTQLEDWVNLYRKGVEITMAKQLHSPHRPDIDAYLEKLGSGVITLQERKEMRDLLFKNLCEKSIEPERCDSVQMLIAIQDLKITQDETGRGNGNPKVITAPSTG
jgi:hypothetical protein